MTAQTLVAHLAKGRIIDAPALRAVLESAFGASDAQGAWSWKDAYEAVEAAQVLFLRRYAPAMFAHAGNNPRAFSRCRKSARCCLAKRGARKAMRCSNSRRRWNSPTSRASRPGSFPATSCSTFSRNGNVAIFAELSSAKLTLNEWRSAAALERFSSAALSRFDGAQINDRLDAIFPEP
jgi:hypothetical protein